MKISERQQRRKDVRNLVITGTRNAVKMSHGGAESTSHKIMKFWVANFCCEHGLEYWTEASVKGGRTDVIISDWKLIIEILESETEKDFRKKSYPLPVIPVQAKITSVADLLEMLKELEVTNGASWEYFAERAFQKIYKPSKTGIQKEAES